MGTKYFTVSFSNYLPVVAVSSDERYVDGGRFLWIDSACAAQRT